MLCACFQQQSHFLSACQDSSNVTPPPRLHAHATTCVNPVLQAEYWRHQSTPIAAPSSGSASPVAAAASPAAASPQRGAASPAAAAAAAAAAGVPGAGDWIVYGNDVDGSAFSEQAADPLGSSKWNLKVWWFRCCQIPLLD
jgi:hypothetical protein